MKKSDQPFPVQIKKIIIENSRVKTFILDTDLTGKPGQFVMVWIPGYDEKPFGIICKDKTGTMISVAAVGESTKALHLMEEGDLVGVRGPYGTAFTIPEKGSSIALVAGGYGIVPLSYLAQEARKHEINVHLFLGARTKDELLFRSWMEEIGVVLHLSTDDGSEGYKGYNTDVFKSQILNSNFQNTKIPNVYSQIKNNIYDKVYVVGPEVMEKKIADICWEKKIPFELSLERYMKCGIGICGQCCVDPTGWRMCVEGPVLTDAQLRQVSEFGQYHRTSSGRIVR